MLLAPTLSSLNDDQHVFTWNEIEKTRNLSNFRLQIPTSKFKKFGVLVSVERITRTTTFDTFAVGNRFPSKWTPHATHTWKWKTLLIIYRISTLRFAQHLHLHKIKSQPMTRSCWIELNWVKHQIVTEAMMRVQCETFSIRNAHDAWINGLLFIVICHTPRRFHCTANDTTATHREIFIAEGEQLQIEEN